MPPLITILGLWRGRTVALLFGLMLSFAALAAALALMQQAGSRIAAAGVGIIAASIGLQIAGPARVLLRYFERLATHDATFRALADLRVWFFRGFAERSAGGLGFRPSGDLLSRLVQDVEALDGLYLRILLPLAGAVLVIPTLIWVIGPMADGWLLLLAIGSLALVAAFVLPALAAQSTAALGERLAIAGSDLRVVIVDILTGRREVRAFSAEARMQALVGERESALVAVQQRVADRAALMTAAAFLCGQSALLALLMYGLGAPTGTIAAVFLVVAGFDAIAGLPRAGALAGHANAAARRLIVAAAGPSSYPDPPQLKPIASSSTLRLDGVHFSWAIDRPEVLSGLTMTIAAGSRVAILGPSGSGKSTIAALMLKVVPPTTGRLSIGGIDLANLAAADVRSRISYLSQESHMFADSIRANLHLGRPAINDAALWSVLDQAAIGDFVRGLPERLDTWLGEGGAGISGGQGRRIALARALLSDAPILLLDEPCDGLDAETEREFMTTLNAIAPEKTVIIIVHRLTGVERVDRIWRISQGLAVAATG